MSSTNPLEAPPKPGYLTSEFIQAMLVHALAAVVTLLDLLHVHWSKGLSGTQAAVPVAAMVISALLQSAYHDKRLALKMDHSSQLARTYVAELENGYHEYEPEIDKLATVVNVVAPQLAPVVKEAEQVADAVATDAAQVDAAIAPEAPADAPAAPVDAPVEEAIPPALPVTAP